MILPNDPLVGSQWYLSNTGQRGEQGYDLNLLPIWGRYSGQGLIVAVNDDGMDLTHPDLVANLLVNLAYDGISDLLGQGFIDHPSLNAHGTVVGSIIGMVANNGVGGTGIAWGAKIVPALVGYGEGQTAKVFLSNLSANAAVSVNSWGDDQAFAENFGASGTESNREWGAALTRLVTEGRAGLGTVIAVSGGNERGNGADIALSNFTGNKLTIAVGAITHDGKPTYYSSQGASLLVTAPGGVASEDSTATDRGFGIASADMTGSLGFNINEGEAGNYAFQSQGTSYSQPMVSAIAALMLEANPKLGFRDVSSILALTARQTDASNASWVQQQGSEWNLGGMHFSRDFGYGLVDAAAAVRLAESWAGGTNTMANWVSTEGVSARPSGVIPDNTPNAFLQATATVAQGITIERLEVDIGLTSVLPNQLRAVLVSPAGTEHTLFDRPLTMALVGEDKVPTEPENAWPGVFTMGITAFMGETSAGTWTLRLSDLVTGESASFNSFAVRAWGQAASSDQQYVFTDEFVGSKTLTDAQGVNTLNAAAVSGAVTLSLAANANNLLPKGSFTLAAGTVIHHAMGGAGHDSIAGNGLNNLLRGNGGDDTIDGQEGIDTAVYGGRAAQATVQKNGAGLLVSGAYDGSDVLLNIERLQFADKSIAMDLDGNAGVTAKVLGAVLGPSSVKNPTFVGIGLGYTDQGMSYSDLGALALSAVGATTHDAVVTTLWRNVVGSGPTEAEKAPFIAMLANGTKPGDLVVLAADTGLNTANIGLVGLAQTGLEFIPV